MFWLLLVMRFKLFSYLRFMLLSLLFLLLLRKLFNLLIFFRYNFQFSFFLISLISLSIISSYSYFSSSRCRPTFLFHPFKSSFQRNTFSWFNFIQYRLQIRIVRLIFKIQRFYILMEFPKQFLSSNTSYQLLFSTWFLLLQNHLKFLLLVLIVDSLPRKLTFEEIDQDIENWHQVISPSLLVAWMSRNGGVSCGSDEGFSSDEFNVFAVFDVSFWESEVNHVHFGLVSSSAY